MDQNELVEQSVVQRYLHELVGTEGMQLALNPPEGEVTDEEIAEDMNLDVNVVRRTLIILNENNLADYRRVRDQDSGWLTYYWAFQYQNIPDQLEEHMEHLVDLLKEREDYERQNEFYRCTVCGERQSFNEAMELQFTCPRCSSDLEVEEYGILDLIEKRRKEIEEELQMD
jgi:transcription initiation factor TFIIE subunit alpha